MSGDEYDVEVHTAAVRGTAMMLVVITAAQVDFQLLPAFHALPFELQREGMACAARDLREVAACLELQLAETNDVP